MNGYIILGVVLAVAATLCRAHANNECIIVAPNVLRLGTNETIVAMVSGHTQQVSIALRNHFYGTAAFFSTTLAVFPGKAATVEVSVGPGDLLQWPLTEVSSWVTLDVACGRLWKHSASLWVSKGSGELHFLQTDKPIYHPGSTVHIRSVALNGSLAPSPTPCKLEIRNPQDVVLEEIPFRPDGDVIFSHHYLLPKSAVLGEWKLVMRYGDEYRQNTTTTFEVKEYVLPRFSVEVKTATPFVLPDFENITCSVIAKFVNGMTVRGVVWFRFLVKNEFGDVQEIGASNAPKKLDEDGKAEYVLRLADVAARLGEGRLAALFTRRARLAVEANVTEEATGIRQSGRNTRVVFSNSPFLVSTARSETSFKPRTRFYVMADVTYVNEEPAKGVTVKLTCSNDGRRNRACPRLGFVATTNANGTVTFNVSDARDGIFTVKVRTSHLVYTEEQQAEALLTLQPYYQASGKYIMIERTDPKFEAEGLFDRVLFTSSNVGTMYAYYVVLSRGRVLQAGSVPMGTVDPHVSFPVTPEMTPSFRVVVVAFLDGQLITDAVYVNAKPACTEGSKFTMTRKSHKPLEPGGNVSLLLKGSSGTRVGLLGVDKSVYLLRRKDLLTREKVLQSMKEKDLGRGVDAGTSNDQTLKNSGIVVLAGQGVSGELGNRPLTKRSTHPDLLGGIEPATLEMCCTFGVTRQVFLLCCSTRTNNVDCAKAYIDCLDSIPVSTQTGYKPMSSPAFLSTGVYGLRSATSHMTSPPQHRPQDFATHLEESFFLLKASWNEEPDAFQFGVERTPFPSGPRTLGRETFDFGEEERKDFRETWIFDARTIKEGPETSVELSLPDSITTWVLSAFSVAPSGGICVHEPIEIPVYKKLFVEVNLPYSVIQNEQIDVPVTVYNYDDRQQQVRLAMLGTPDVCSGAKTGKPSAVHTLNVTANQGSTVLFPVVPLAPGDREIRVAVISDTAGRDGAKVVLKVEPPGVKKQDSFNIILSPAGRRRTRRTREVNNAITYTEIKEPGEHTIQIAEPHRLPEDVIPGSEACEIDIVGSAMGAAVETSVKDPESLFRLPTGCGEQTMSKLAPTLYAYEYLSTTGRISVQDKETALSYIKHGYANILGYRNDDGSFSIFPGTSSSLWLTAFVVRTLCEGRKYVSVDGCVISSGLQYILQQQQSDGRFFDFHYLYDRALLGGVEGPVPLTAYILLTLLECSKDGAEVAELQGPSARAASFIMKELPSADPYVNSLAAYAFSLGNSSAKSDALRTVQNSLQIGVNGGLYVRAESDSKSVLATSYALMALLNARDSKSNINGLVKWLNLRMNPRGSLATTQDTVVALQALSKYAIYAREDDIDMTCEVTQVEPMEYSQRQPVFNHTLRITRDNAHVRNRITIPNSKGPVSVKVTGNGMANLYYLSTYVAPVESGSQCKYDISINLQKTTVNVSPDSSGTRHKREDMYRMDVCMRSLVKDLTGMTILDVGLLTGFRAETSDLQKLVTDKLVDRFEDSSRRVVFYLPTIPEDKRVCIGFGLKQEFGVAMLQSASVKVYAYYDPAMHCTKFYAPDTTSPLLKINCKTSTTGHADVCQCLEGGCPPMNASDIFTKNQYGEPVNETMSQEYLREYVCDYADFVWLGTAQQKTHRDGFIYVPLHITKVLKAGTEDNLVNKVRTIKSRENCKSFSLTHGNEYIVMGMDAKDKEKVDSCDEQYVYVIDSESMVIPYTVGMQQQPSEVSRPTSSRFSAPAKLTARSGARIWNDLVVRFVREFNVATRCFA